MIYEGPGFRCSYRLFEWVSGFALSAYGLHITLSPSTLANSRHGILLVLFPPMLYGALCFVVGALRLVSLYKNGEWPKWGPRIRVGLALIAVMLYAQIAVALLQWASPGVWMYLAFCLGELATVWRAQREANASRTR